MTPEKIGERSLALFFLGLLLFNPPILSLFSVDGFLFGIPVLYVYLFASWTAFVALMAIRAHDAESVDASHPGPPRPPARRGEPARDA